MYRLYIDETGNADLNASRNPNHRYLSLTGIIMDADYCRKEVFPTLEAIKADIFGSHPDEPVILHRKEIIARTGPFACLRDPLKQAEFNARFLDFLRALDCRVVTVVIDKLEHLTRYKVWRYDPYHYCLEAIIERYCMYLRERGAKGDVMAEVRGGKPDRRLENSYANLYANGGANLKKIEMPLRLTSSAIKMKPKAANIAGLQVADLLANPSASYVRSMYINDPAPTRFSAEIVAILTASKYRRSFRNIIKGYGIKWLP
jgi:hypothetical protein